MRRLLTNAAHRYPFRTFAVHSRSKVRYILMKATTYWVWRALLRGARVEIHASALDYQPMIHATKFDAGEPVPTRVAGDFAVYNAHRLTWGSMRRYLSMLRGEATMHLYGSLKASLAGCEHGVHEGVFVDVAMTFRYLSTLDNPFIRYAVTIHQAGPELEALAFDEDPEKSLEVALLEQAELAPTTTLATHEAWKSRIRLPALMKALEMHPLRDTVVSEGLMRPIVPEKKRSGS